MTRRMRVLRTKLGLGDEGFDAAMLALRKFTTTELMVAGFDPAQSTEATLNAALGLGDDL